MDSAAHQIHRCVVFDWMKTFGMSYRWAYYLTPLNLERMPANSDQTSSASLPFLACYEHVFFGCLCIRMNCLSQSEGYASKFGSSICHEFNSFVSLHSSLELFRNLKWVLLSCYFWLWIRFPNPLWGRLHWPILDIPNSKWPKHWTLTTLAWSALWGFDFKIKMISNILFFRANIIFISPSSSTDWCLLVLSLYWCKSESRLVYSSFLSWLYVFIGWIG